MDAEDNFFITLPSTSSRNFYPDNSMTNYRVILPAQIIFKGNYEVGLADLTFPKLFEVTQHSFAVYNLETGYSKSYTIGKRVYRGAAEFVQYINDTLHNDSEIDISISINPLTSIVSVTVGPHCGFCTEPSLFNLLGFYDKLTLTDFQAPLGDPSGKLSRSGTEPCTLNFIYAIYLYTDIIAMEIVGDIKAKLLEIVPVNENNSGTVHYRADKIRYHPLEKKVVGEIEIQLRSSLGSPIPFAQGRVVTCLHFRRRI